MLQHSEVRSIYDVDIGMGWRRTDPLIPGESEPGIHQVERLEDPRAIVVQETSKRSYRD